MHSHRMHCMLVRIASETPMLDRSWAARCKGRWAAAAVYRALGLDPPVDSRGCTERHGTLCGPAPRRVRRRVRIGEVRVHRTVVLPGVVEVCRIRRAGSTRMHCMVVLVVGAALLAAEVLISVARCQLDPSGSDHRFPRGSCPYQGSPRFSRALQPPSVLSSMGRGMGRGRAN